MSSGGGGMSSGGGLGDPSGDTKPVSVLVGRTLLVADNITNSIVEGSEVGRYRNVRILDPMTYGIALETRF